MASIKRKADAATSSGETKKPKRDGSLTSFFGAPKPKPKPVASSSNAGGEASDTATFNKDSGGEASLTATFNKDKWVAGLTAEERELLQLEIDTLDVSWLAHLTDELTRPAFLDLKRFLRQELAAGKKIFPPMEDVYSWSRHTPLHTVRVVILGQDPYHNHNQAHGLCFSVRPPTPAPPSLRNIYIALRNDYPDFQAPPGNGGLLTPWAEQGVLMLNTALTVRAHAAGSHAGRGWEAFTQRVIDTVVRVRTRGVVFLAWGLPAAKRCAKIGTAAAGRGRDARHLVLKSVHPSPLSASRGFFDCGHFRKANDWLAQRYGPDGQIDWNLGGKAKGSAAVSTTPGTSTASAGTTGAATSAGTTGAATSTGTAAAATSTSTSTASTASTGNGNDKTKDNSKDDDDDDDEFDKDDADADAIEALEELARSSQAEGT